MVSELPSRTDLSPRVSTEVKISAPTTAIDLLGIHFQEPEGLSIAKAPITILGKTSAEESHFYAVIDYPLYSGSFLTFLNELSPIKFTAGREGVLADWRMPDLDDKENKQLRKIHQVIPGWESFLAHRQTFIATLQSIDPVSIQAEFNRRITDKDNFLSKSIGAYNHLADIMNNSENPYSAEANEVVGKLARKFRNWAKLKAAISSDARTGSRPSHPDLAIFGLSDEAAVLCYAFLQCSISVQNEVMKRGMEAHKDKVTIELPNGEIVFIVNVGQSFQVRTKDEKGEIEVRAGESLAIGSVGRSDRETSFVHDPSKAKWPKPLVPVVAWKTDKHGRHVDLNPDINGELRMFDGSTQSKRYSSLAGFLAIAYMESGLREDWPNEQRVHGSDRNQQMSAAQVPLLALQYQERFMDSEFIRRAEEFLEKTTKPA